MQVQEIEALIRKGLPDADVKVEDPFNDRTHFKATIISPSFEGKTKIQQHRMVYDALGDAFDGPLHALQLATRAPETK